MQEQKAEVEDISVLMRLSSEGLSMAKIQAAIPATKFKAALQGQHPLSEPKQIS